MTDATPLVRRPPRRLRKSLGVLLVVVVAYLAWAWRPAAPEPWTEAELSLLRSLWIENLPPLPAVSSNAVADNPDAQILGRRLFFDTRLSANGQVSCASCHQPQQRFTDGLVKGRGIGEAARNTRSIVGVAYSPWLYWDGRRDSLWSQALTPLEDPQEHGSNRMAIVRLVSADETYRVLYEKVFDSPPDFSDESRFPAAAAPFGDDARTNAWSGMRKDDRMLVNQVFSNVGKAIAAFERTLLPEETRFDEYVAAVVEGDSRSQEALFDDDETLGLKLFVGKARCIECHNGPLLTNHEFHNTGIISFAAELPDRGRANGLRELLQDPFNCLGDFSDADEKACDELRFVRSGPELLGAMRTPSLRNLFDTAPYMHKGQLESLRAVLEHYNRAPDAMIGHNEAEPLKLSGRELQQLEAFLETLAPLTTRRVADAR